jgi:hypothetical protein
MITVTAQQRRITCYHEAGHAVVTSLRGNRPSYLEVVDAGISFEEIAAEHDNRFGFCKPSNGFETFGREFRHTNGDTVIRGFELPGYHPDTDEVDRQKARAFAKTLSEYDRRDWRRIIRGRVCMNIAGQVAEQHYTGAIPLQDLIDGSDWIEPWDFGDDDSHEMRQAARMACLLPARNAYDRMSAITARALLDHWQHVERIADALESEGHLLFNDLTALIPAEIPNWPPARSTSK